MRLFIEQAMSVDDLNNQSNDQEKPVVKVPSEFRKAVLKAAKETKNSDLVSPLLLQLDYENTQNHLPALILSVNLT